MGPISACLCDSFEFITSASGRDLAMSVRLTSSQYLPRGADGWGSKLLHFGDMFTAVQGPNGTGKTPIMRSVIQGLGHEVEMPPDVMARCQFAETTLMVEGRSVVLTRRLGSDFRHSRGRRPSSTDIYQPSRIRAVVH
jgi:hypothetical protein